MLRVDEIKPADPSKIRAQLRSDVENLINMQHLATELCGYECFSIEDTVDVVFRVLTCLKDLAISVFLADKLLSISSFNLPEFYQMLSFTESLKLIDTHQPVTDRDREEMYKLAQLLANPEENIRKQQIRLNLIELKRIINEKYGELLNSCQQTIEQQSLEFKKIGLQWHEKHTIHNSMDESYVINAVKEATLTDEHSLEKIAVILQHYVDVTNLRKIKNLFALLEKNPDCKQGVVSRISLSPIVFLGNEIETINFLLKQGVSPNKTTHGIEGEWTPLYWAVVYNEIAVIKLFLKSGVYPGPNPDWNYPDLEYNNIKHSTLFAWAVNHRQIDIMKMLKGIVDPNSNTHFSTDAQGNRLSLFDSLISIDRLEKEQEEKHSEEKVSPKPTKLDVLHLLIGMGIELNPPDLKDSPLFIALNMKEKAKDIIDFLVLHGSDCTVVEMFDSEVQVYLFAGSSSDSTYEFILTHAWQDDKHKMAVKHLEFILKKGYSLDDISIMLQSAYPELVRELVMHVVASERSDILFKIYDTYNQEKLVRLSVEDEQAVVMCLKYNKSISKQSCLKLMGKLQKISIDKIDDDLVLDNYPDLLIAIKNYNDLSATPDSKDRYYKIAKKLLNKKDSNFVRPSESSRNLLDLAYIPLLSNYNDSSSQDKKMFYLLLSELDVNERSVYQQSILHIAVTQQAPIFDIVIFLLCGVDPSLLDSPYNKKAIQYINQAYQDAEACRALLEQGLSFLFKPGNAELLQKIIAELGEDCKCCPEARPIYESLIILQMRKTDLDAIQARDLQRFFMIIDGLSTVDKVNRMIEIWGDERVILDWLTSNKTQLLPVVLLHDVYEALEQELVTRVQKFKFNDAALEFKARYNIDVEVIRESKVGDFTFSLDEENYLSLLRSCNNKIDILPFELVKDRRSGKWHIVLLEREYNNIVKANEENLKAITTIFKNYQTHLATYPGEWKEAALIQRDFIVKRAKVDEVLGKIEDKKNDSQQETTANRIIALRKILPNAGPKIKANRDEWPFWILKLIVTILTVGIAHCCGNIWQVKGADSINEVEAILRPNR